MADSHIAQASTGIANDEMKNMYLNFNVGNEVYGVEVRYVLRIIGMQEITAMPEMPLFMKGFINLRGSVIPVVSMRLRFGKNEDEYTERTCITVVKVGKREIGLIVDAIQETITIEPEQISPPPTASRNTECTYVQGIARLRDNRSSILVSICNLFDEIQI